jgi:hypothetical protein
MKIAAAGDIFVNSNLRKITFFFSLCFSCYDFLAESLPVLSRALNTCAGARVGDEFALPYTGSDLALNCVAV